MKLLVLVNNYSGRNSDNSCAAVEKVLQTFSGYTRIEVDIILFSTADYAGYDVINLIYPEALSYAFAYVPRQWLVENFCCLSHDYYMYTENDLIISQPALLDCIHINEDLSRISRRLAAGFIRYEQRAEKIYIDMLPCTRPTVEKTLQTAEGQKFWIPGNIHSGNFLLSRSQLAHLIDCNLFQTRFAQYGKQYGGILESAASDVYLDFQKVLPEDFTRVEIEHISNKYDGLTHRQLRNEVAAPSGAIGC